MRVIGLTGGIASGKSAVSTYLHRVGAAIIDADAVAREVVLPHRKAWEKIVGDFGTGVLNADQTINRALLGQIVFSDPVKLERLNQITHPEIVQAIRTKISEHRVSGDHQLVIVDAPLLIETGLHRVVDEVWVIYVNPEVQLERLLKRDRLALEQAQERIKSQMPFSEKVKVADRVFDNSGTLDKTLAEIEQYLKKSDAVHVE